MLNIVLKVDKDVAAPIFGPFVWDCQATSTWITLHSDHITMLCAQVFWRFWWLFPCCILAAPEMCSMTANQALVVMNPSPVPVVSYQVCHTSMGWTHVNLYPVNHHISWPTMWVCSFGFMRSSSMMGYVPWNSTWALPLNWVHITSNRSSASM